MLIVSAAAIISLLILSKAKRNIRRQSMKYSLIMKTGMNLPMNDGEIVLLLTPGLS
jgi:hypothetical protein